MNEQPTERHLLIHLVIVAALGVALGRLASAERIYEPSNEAKRGARSAFASGKTPTPMPTFGSNDRSRWATVRALVEDGTFVIGHRSRPDAAAVALFAATTPLQAVTIHAVRLNDRGIIFEDGWQSVDKVLHPMTGEFYSSKPPLLPVLMAGAYWPVYHLAGLSLEDEPFLVVRLLVGLLNLLPLALYLWLLYRVGERYASHPWTAAFILTAGAFGTLLNPFLITFSNHVPAVYGTLFLLVLVLKIDRDGPAASTGWYLLAGLLGGLNATMELPSLAFTALAFVLLARVSWTRALFAYLPAVALPLAALVGLNYLILERIVPVYAETSSIWYQYEGSHWLPKPTSSGIDYAYLKEDKYAYAFNLLIGHHGFFALTPVFLLGLLGLLIGLRPASGSAASADGRTPLPWWLAPSVLLLSVVVIGFYIYRTNNYGGWTNGPRWLMWLTPLWLVAMIPALDWLARWRLGRAVALVLLLMSILSASYFDWNPWRHPWIYNWMDSAGRIPY